MSARDERGQSALDAANSNGHSAVVRLLREAKTSQVPAASRTDDIYALGTTPGTPVTGSTGAGTGGNLAALSAAVERGEEIVFKIKYDYAVSPCHYLHDGRLSVSKTAVAFDGSIGDLDFTVSPDKILEVTNQPQQASLVRLKVAVKNKKGDKESKRDLYFYNLGAATVGSGPGGTGLSIACNRCDDSMSVLYALLQKVRGKS